MQNYQSCTIRSFSFLIICNVALLALTASAETRDSSRCQQNTEVAFKESVTASAGVFANLRNARGSAKFETSRLVTNALATLEAQRASSIASKAADEVIILKSSPNKLLQDSEDSEFCAAVEKQTIQSPIRYPDRSFASSRELTSWISDLQQGSGTDGKDLYKQCAKSCSPRITYIISNSSNSGLQATAEVVCGPARDKDENMYKIAYGITSRC